jgi:hypothetical protein
MQYIIQAVTKGVQFTDERDKEQCQGVDEGFLPGL